MIKVNFKDESAARLRYLNLIAKLVAHRLTILRTSLIHLSSAPNKDDPNFESFEAVTKKIINSLQTKKQKLADKKFNKAVYDQTVTDYVTSNKAKLNKIHFLQLIRLIDGLLANKGRILIRLLVCPANNLQRINNGLMAGISGKWSLHALSLAFDWDLHKEITSKIKQFFNDESVVVYCPYCNINEADYSESVSKDKVGSHFFLDHFFDKKRSPLLTFCMFNLVTCDAICNGSNNKGSTSFSDEFHLNPYISGMDRSRMIFQPVVTKVGQNPDRIDLFVLPPQSAQRYQQLIGNYPTIDESRKEGNINVFSLEIKYNRKHIKDRAGTAVRKLEDHFQTRDSIAKFLIKMGKKLDVDIYEEWYREEFNTEFLPEKFSDAMLSKLVRDIHDNLLEPDTDPENKEFKKIMHKHPA